MKLRGRAPSPLGSTCLGRGPACHRNGSYELVASWVTLLTFKSDPQMLRTSLNYSLNKSLFVQLMILITDHLNGGML